MKAKSGLIKFSKPSSFDARFSATGVPLSKHAPNAGASAGAQNPSTLAIIRQILGGEDLPKRYQNPKLEIRRDVARPYYFVRVTVPTVDGRRKRIPQFLGFVDETSNREAIAIRGERLEVVNQGRVLLQARIRFKDLVKQFTETRIPQFKSSTQDWYRSLIDTHLLPVFGEKQLMQIDCQCVEAFLVSREQAGLSWWTRKGLLGVMAAIFNAARDWKLWSGDSPTVGVCLGKKREVREKRLLSPDDMRRLLGAVEGPVRFIILIIFGTGLRISEVLGLRWRNIDLDGGTLTVQQRWYRGDLDEPKTEASERTRQLGPLVDEFRRLYPGKHASDRFVFIGDDGHAPPDERDLLRYNLRPRLRGLGIYYPGFGWHAFRRQNITWRQTVGGATPFEAQRGAGHAHADTTFLYTLSDSEREREQVTRMFDRLMEVPPGRPQ